MGDSIPWQLQLGGFIVIFVILPLVESWKLKREADKFRKDLDVISAERRESYKNVLKRLNRALILCIVFPFGTVLNGALIVTAALNHRENPILARYSFLLVLLLAPLNGGVGLFAVNSSFSAIHDAKLARSSKDTELELPE